MGNRSERFDAAVTELGLAWRSGDQARTAAARVNLERVHCDLMDEAASPPPADERNSDEGEWVARLAEQTDAALASSRVAPRDEARPGWVAKRLARAVLDGAGATPAAMTFARGVLGLPLTEEDEAPAPRDEAREALRELADKCGAVLDRLDDTGWKSTPVPYLAGWRRALIGAATKALDRARRLLSSPASDTKEEHRG